MSGIYELHEIEKGSHAAHVLLIPDSGISSSKLFKLNQSN
jgi:hypothetical protein